MTDLAFAPSVCICTRNRPDELGRALASITRSTLPAAQVVVADDSTDDRSRAVAEAHPNAVWVQGPKVGLGANRNAALAAATGTHVLFIDDDVELDPAFLGLVRDRLAALPSTRRDRVIVAGCEWQHGLKVTPNEQGRLGHQSRPYRPGEPLRTVVINAAVFPRTVFDRVRFDPQLVYGYDEVDVTTQAVAAGFEIEACFEAGNHHFPSPAGRDYYQPHREASRIYVTRKRLALTERRRGRAAAFTVVSAAHAVASAARSRGPAGLAEGWASVRESRRLWREHVGAAAPASR